MEENNMGMPANPAPKSAWPWVVVVIVILVVAGGYWWYVSGSEKFDSDDTAKTVNDSAIVDDISAADDNAVTSDDSVNINVDGGTTPAAVEFTISATSFSFSPATLTVKKGDYVSITFVNDGGYHDFVLDEFNIRTPQLQSGQTALLGFPADKVGSFEYYCSVGNHRAMGMTGTLTVTE